VRRGEFGRAVKQVSVRELITLINSDRITYDLLYNSFLPHDLRMIAGVEPMPLITPYEQPIMRADYAKFIDHDQPACAYYNA
jgi:hypothetical protein